MNKLTYTLSLTALALAAVSCDSNTQPAPWQPAEPSAAAGVFFTNTDNVLSVTVGEDTHVAIPVRRLNDEGTLSVPLVVTEGHPNLIVPEEVTFADGQRDSQIVLDLAQLPTKQLISVGIIFPDEYINPYAAGPSAFDGSVLVSDWEAVTEQPVRLQWLDWSYNATTIFDPIDHVVMNLPGTNRYRILNFLNSGIDFTFDLQPSTYAGWTGYNRVMPLGNQVLYSEYSWTGYYNPWWLVEDDLQEWPVLELTSNGQQVSVYGPSFMWYDDEYGNEYCHMRLQGSADASGNIAETTKLYMAFYGFYDESWDWSNFTGYLFLYFEFASK